MQLNNMLQGVQKCQPFPAFYLEILLEKPWLFSRALLIVWSNCIHFLTVMGAFICRRLIANGISCHKVHVVLGKQFCAADAVQPS